MRVLLIALGYTLVAKVSLPLFVFRPEMSAAFWPPSGYLLSTLVLIHERRRWPLLLAALFAANATANFIEHSYFPPLHRTLVSLGLAFANCFEALVVAIPLARLVGLPLSLTRLRNVLGFMVVVVVGNAVAALVGAAVLRLGFDAPYLGAWWVWWISDAMGMLLVTPVVVSWVVAGKEALKSFTPGRALEAVALLGAMALVAYFVFSSDARNLRLVLPVPYAVFPFLLWAAVRFGTQGSLAALVLAGIAVWYTRAGAGPFGATFTDTAPRVISVQIFLSVAVLSSLMLAAVITERRQAEETVRHTNANLEIRIQERTRELSQTNLALQAEIAERVRAEAAVRRTAEELARSNAELEQFAYVASHDLQEPLRAVAGMVQLLQKRYEGQLDAKAQELISHAMDGAARMRNLITDLLAYSRVGNKAPVAKPVDCSAVMKNVLTNLTAAISESGAVVTHELPPTVRADPTQLTQLLQNLIGNAIKFRGEDRRPEIHIRGERKDGETVFQVRDNGIGIEPQYFDRIFGIFQRLHTRTAYPGTGIGLAICKKIVERHGGRIWVESQPGQGTSFYFTFPEEEPSPGTPS